ncbi:hypothetical protein S40285_02826 [Stachybotrys chlorohalonatus IBT 40285]|uniref:Sodium/calcium exchanger membrane region domain-containing protein n=1 Tax=Stachybotrys chlorohalonatus (strain IBT 40285) TaxID=1283841 RepID=A0A084QDA5_STAC4|nr:hypothetical protein S40285_02826 [Stachybotrys chlorohalonata IBT 40285]
MSVNSWQLKRLAHSVSRSSDEQRWNPFRHVAWSRGRSRRDGEEGPDLERQQRRSRGGRDGGASSRSVTDNDDGGMASASASTGARDRDGSVRSRSRETAVDGQDGASQEHHGAGLRNRKQDEHGRGQEQEQEQQPPGKTKLKDRKQSGLIRHVYPKTPFTVANQLQRTFLNSWINVLLLAAPVGIALANIPSIDRIVVFVVNFVAIIPLAAMLSFATEEIALRTGETLGGLLNATFGNAVELIIAVIALVDGKIAIVQTSLIGSILSNLLLVMGFCFFFGGLRRPEQHFNHTVAQTAASMLALAAASVIVPTVFDYASETPQADVASLSRGTSVILLVVYAAYLLFQLKTHQSVFSERSKKVPAKPWSAHPRPLSSEAVKQGIVMPASLAAQGVLEQKEVETLSHMLMNPLRPDDDDSDNDHGEEGEEEPQLNFVVAMATLAASTAVIAVCAEYMVDSIDAVTASGHLSEEFVGLILLPIVGNAAEHATAVTVAIKDKMDLAIGVAVGSSMQVALFLIPLLVVIGWVMGREAMTLSFDMFQVAVMFVAVLLTNYLIGDGKSNWLEGFLMICLYAIIAVCAFWYPQELGT